MNRVEEALVRGGASTRRDAMRCVRERWCGSVRRGVRRSGGGGCARRRCMVCTPLESSGLALGDPRRGFARRCQAATRPQTCKYKSARRVQQKAAKSARLRQHCNEDPQKAHVVRGVEDVRRSFPRRCCWPRRKELRTLRIFQTPLIFTPLGDVRAGSFSRQSRALCTLSVCATCSLITFPQALRPKRRPFRLKNACPTEALGLESHSESPEERPRG